MGIKADGKSVSKNIFEDHEYLKNQDEIDETTESMSESQTRNSTRYITDIDSDVQSERSFTLDSLPSCNDDVSSISSSRINSARGGTKIMIESDSEDDDGDCPVLEEVSEQQGSGN